MGLVSQHTSKDIGGDNETPYGRAHKRFSFSRFLAETETFSCANGFPILFLTAYVNANLMMFFWGAREQFKHTKGQKMRWLISIARGFGYTLNLNCALVIVLASRLLFTVIRRTPLNLVFPFDKTFPAFHMIVGYVIAISVMGHGIFHMVWIAGWKKWSGGLWGISMCVCTGFLLSGILATMVFTSRLSFRKGRFKAFFAVHNAGAFFFFTILIFHGVYNGKPYTYKWLVLPLVIYICDRVSRRIKISSSNLDLNKEHMVLKGEDVLRIKTPKEFSYQAGQYAGRFFPHSFVI